MALFCTLVPVLAGEVPSGAVLSTEKEMALYQDFRDRFEVAFASQELASVAALYQTNGVSALELKSELARWRQVVEEGAKPMPPYLKIFSELPPEARKHWEAYAHHLTSHQVSAIAAVRFQGGFQMTLPLALVGDSLLIVPSEKIANKSAESSGAKDASQPKN